MDSTQIEALLAEARAARERAYAPYSNFAVGAAALVDDGRVFHGCNIENAAYPVTMCAERVALFAARAAGAGRVVAVAVVADTAGPVSPCGSCRQVLLELAPGSVVVLGDMDDQRAITTPEALLPGGFTPADLRTGQQP